MKEELAKLERMTVGELVERYVELYGEPVRTRHREYLVRKVAWRLQANAEGDLTERARRRAAEREPIGLAMPFSLHSSTYTASGNRFQNSALM